MSSSIPGAGTSELISSNSSPNIRSSDWGKLVHEKMEALRKGLPSPSISAETWQKAWLQQIQKLKNANIKNVPSDVLTYLYKKIASLPAGCNERITYEAIACTLTGVAEPRGCFLDNPTQEMHNFLKRLTGQFKCLEQAMSKGISDRKLNEFDDVNVRFSQQPPAAYTNPNFIGNGSAPVLAITSWREKFAAAAQPISEAYGSHADMKSAIVKNQTGAEQPLPTATINVLDSISKTFADQTIAGFAQAGFERLRDLPATVCGSLRQLLTAFNKLLAVPYKIFSDIFQGLLKFLDELSQLVEAAISFVIKWIKTNIIDAVLPDDMFEDLAEPFMEVSSFLNGFAGLLMGHGALGGIASQIGNLGQAFAGKLSSGAKLLVLFNSIANVIEIGSSLRVKVCGDKVFGTAPPPIVNTLRKAANIAGLLSNSGLANLQLMLSKSVRSFLLPPGFSKLISNNRDVSAADILKALLPPRIVSAIETLWQYCCGVGYHGNLGFSVGNIFDGYNSLAYEASLLEFPTLSNIFSKNFNKKTTPLFSYDKEETVARLKTKINVTSTAPTNTTLSIGIRPTPKVGEVPTNTQIPSTSSIDVLDPNYTILHRTLDLSISPFGVTLAPPK